MAAEIRKAGSLTGVYVEAFNDGMTYSLTIVESQAMQQEVVADAKAMRDDLVDPRACRPWGSPPQLDNTL